MEFRKWQFKFYEVKDVAEDSGKRMGRGAKLHMIAIIYKR